MVTLGQLWLPIVVSAVFVFVASSLVHMVLRYHWTDYGKLPDEGATRKALKGLPPGDYMFPRPASPAEMSAPETIEKYTEGPVGLMTVLPSGPPAMGKQLGLWFVYSVLVGVAVAYLTGRTLGPGVDYLQVFRVSGTVAFLAYGGGEPVRSIWWGRSWTTTGKHLLDGLIYALVTAGAFGWLWPS